jgi:hypothetical protein
MNVRYWRYSHAGDSTPQPGEEGGIERLRLGLHPSFPSLLLFCFHSDRQHTYAHESHPGSLAIHTAHVPHAPDPAWNAST